MNTPSPNVPVITLLVGLHEDTVKTANTLLEGIANAGQSAAIFMPQDTRSVDEVVARWDAAVHHTIGAWLVGIDVVVPLLPTSSSAAWTATLGQCSQLDREITRMKQTPDQSPPPACCWIKSIAPEDASPTLAAIYDQLTGAHGKLHNLYRSFSLRPASVIPADAHYRAILHDPELISEPWFLELLASQAATLAGCTYALSNHGENFINLLGDRNVGEAMLKALHDRDYKTLFTDRQSALLVFAEMLCLRPHAATEAEIMNLRATGISDVEILESVQATACFAYWTRLINGIGISMGSESVGRLDLEKA